MSSASFAQACGDANAGDCCSSNGSPACNDLACCTAVCAADSFCCAVTWDSVCAGEAASLCPDLCQGGGGVCGTGGDCCTPNGGLGCNDVTCCETVCGIDSFCCAVSWDSVCASEAASLCGDLCAGAGCGGSVNDCCAPGAGPGCNDADCCALVCAIDSFCCFVAWDSVCASEAGALCAVCGAGSCPVDCSNATVEEGEICGDDSNGGCNNPNDPVSYIDVGDIVCGIEWADGGTRDTDWYEFTLSEGKILDFTVTAEIPTVLFLATAGCPTAVLTSAQTSNCVAAIDDKCLLAGTYRVIVAPAFFAGFPCGNTNGFKYTLAITDTGQTCTGPENDSCEGAIQVADPSDTNFDSTLAFTNGDPLPAECASFGSVTIFNDLWYKFTATKSGLYQISTCDQASYDTRLALYTGPCNNLNIVACNDDGDGCGGFTSKILIGLDGGTEYWVRVGGFGEGGGSGVLTIGQLEACDTACPPGAIVETEACGDDDNGGCNTVGDSTCCFANGGIGCDDPSCQEAVCAIDSFCCAIAWDGVCAAEAVSFCGTLCQVEPGYQDITVGTPVCGTFWATGGTRDTDWYRFHLDTDATVTLTCNSTLNVAIGFLDTNCPPTVIAFDTTQSCGATISACLPAGDHVAFIALAGFDFPPCGSDPLNNYTFTLTAGESCALGNDECDSAVPIFDGDTAYSTDGATTSGLPLDPSCDKGFGTNFVQDIWFTYTATCTGTATFSTCGTVNYDSRLALYSGDCANLSIVACNDDGSGCPSFTSLMTADVTQGTTYYLRVGGYSGGGSGTINIACGGGGGGPTNDDCANALPLSVGATAFSTVGATGTTQMDPGACTFFGSSVIYNDVWYDYVATGDGPVTITTCNGASFDTRIAVFTDCDLTSTVACNDDFSGCGLTSSVTFTPVCGTHYKVTVGAYSQTGFGTGTITVTQDGSCPVVCVGDLNGDGVVDAQDLGILLGGWGGGGVADLNGDGTVDAQDLGILLGAWGPCAG
ncbi:MAG: hypothetical protein U0572_09580 [Phycisphaerales bacterium]